MAARYEGRPTVEFLADGRQVKLLTDLTFYDPADTRWAVPAGAIVDGASIPRLFWPIIGAPLDGNYRDASIVHDWYCDRRTRTWQATHRVFYEAMLVSGVPHTKAKIMYFAVRWRGPRWEERVSMNNILGGGRIGRFYNLVTLRPTETVMVQSPGTTFDEEDQVRLLSKKIEEIERDGYELEQIDELADSLKAES